MSFCSGPSGSGKSTLLRLLKKEIQPHGNLTFGDIHLKGRPLEETDKIGFVFQDPENQVVSSDVLHELVFGLENTGMSTAKMRARVAEMVHYFGAESVLQQSTQQLSGGKKQQINVASVLLMQPDVLLLDEPTSQLDPVSTREFLDLLVRLNEEFGMTIILAEHRLEEVISLCDRMVFMESGKVVYEGAPATLLPKLWNSHYHEYVPSISALYFMLGGKGRVPLSVKEGRQWIDGSEQLNDSKITEFTFSLHDADMKNFNKKTDEREHLLSVKQAFYRYEKSMKFVLDELDFHLEQGEFYALMGGMGLVNRHF